MEVTGSSVVVEGVLASARLSRSSTHCTVWATAAVALAIACEGVVFRSLETVAKADCAFARLPELMALPNAVISVENWEAVEVVADELDAELLAAGEVAVWFSCL